MIKLSLTKLNREFLIKFSPKFQGTNQDFYFIKRSDVGLVARPTVIVKKLFLVNGMG